MNDEMYNLLAKYFSGQASAEEESSVKNWAAASAENREDLEFAKKLWEKTGENSKIQFDTEAAWQKIKRVIEERPASNKGLVKRMVFRITTAAAAVLLLIAGIWWLTLSSNKNKTVTADTAVKEILLADGSHVYLRKNASLSFAQHFKKDKREVTLSGEAFFEIAKDPAKPFVITASGTAVRVLGTSFTVNTNKGQVEVVVKTGLVQFSSLKDSGQSAVLQPGDKAVIKEDKLVKEKNADENFNSWQTGTIRFRNTPMQEVMQTLGHHYQVSIVCKKGEEDKVLTPLVTTVFRNQSLEAVIKELELITTFHIRKVSDAAYEISSQ